MDTGNGTWLYTLPLDGTAAQDLADAVSSELGTAQDGSGNAQIIIKDGTIARIYCECTDSAEETFSAELVFSKKSGFEVPAAVKELFLER